MALIIRVKECGDCPFCHNWAIWRPKGASPLDGMTEYEVDVCAHPESDEKKIEFMYPLMFPDWCPLRKAPVALGLADRNWSTNCQAFKESEASDG